MKKHHVLILFLLFAGLAKTSVAQQPSVQKYLIITFAEDWKMTEDAPHYYCWIVPQDSLRDRSSFSYLCLAFFKNHLTDCCNGKEINPFVIYAQENHENLDAAYYKDLDKLKEIITRNRTKVEVITKKWQNGQEQDITVYATPVSGKFCSSYLDQFGQYDYHYKGKLYLPYSTFTYDAGFWNSTDAKYILHEDFSRINFKILPFPSFQ